MLRRPLVSARVTASRPAVEQALRRAPRPRARSVPTLAERSAGALLHLTSLPGEFGNGDLGPEARAFADFLALAGLRWWQMLPVGPAGYGNSPYSAHSAFAGSPLLVNLEQLRRDGLLPRTAFAGKPRFPRRRVDFAAVGHYRTLALRKAFDTFEREGQRRRGLFDEYCEQQRGWLDDWALYAALKRVNGLRTWTDWAPELRDRHPDALAAARADLARDIAFHKFEQYLFDKQWHAFREDVAAKGIGLIGDLPIFVAHDSADVWAHRELFTLDEQGQPTFISGVPPDYFSKTGQRWGNPLYRWDRMKQDGYAWWVARMRQMLERFDVVRLDHFIGFQNYWEIPASEPTAQNGRWVPGPGADFFEALEGALGSAGAGTEAGGTAGTEARATPEAGATAGTEARATAGTEAGATAGTEAGATDPGPKLPLIAEDLGAVTPAVKALRDRFRLPGLRILQFAFGTDPSAPDFKPHNYVKNAVVYTGTHDNDTIVGWFHDPGGKGLPRSPAQTEKERRYAMRYLHSDGREIHWDMLRAIVSSVANLAIAPVQDLLGLGSEARMNRPGLGAGNWEWRLRAGSLTRPLAARVRELLALYDR